MLDRQSIVTSLLATTARAWNLAQPPADSATAAWADWPRAFAVEQDHVVMYRPRILRWTGKRIEALAAVAVSATCGKRGGTRAYGVAHFSAQAHIVQAHDLVRLTHIEFEPVEIPTDPEMARRIERALVSCLSTNGMDVSFDKLQMSCAASQGFTRAMRNAMRKRSFTDWVKDATSGSLFRMA